MNDARDVRVLVAMQALIGGGAHLHLDMRGRTRLEQTLVVVVVVVGSAQLGLVEVEVLVVQIAIVFVVVIFIFAARLVHVLDFFVHFAHLSVEVLVDVVLVVVVRLLLVVDGRDEAEVLVVGGRLVGNARGNGAQGRRCSRQRHPGRIVARLLGRLELASIGAILARV